MAGTKLHWQAGQGDNERRGGEEGVGLGQRDPEVETRGRVDKGRGETGREASWVTRDSLLGDAVTEGEAKPEGEEETGGTGVMRVRLAGVVAVIEGAVV